MLDGERHPLVLTLSGVVPADGRVWSTVIRELPRNLTALAIVSTKPARMGEFAKAIGALLLPVKVFSNADEAAEWAGQFLED